MRILKPQSLLLLSLLTALAIAPLWAQNATYLPAGQVGVLYQYIVPAQGGQPPLTWSVKGRLPDGLRLNKHNGAIWGVPTKAGTFPFVIYVKDSSKRRGSQRQSYTIQIESAGAVSIEKAEELPAPFCADPPEVNGYDMRRLVQENYLEIVYDAASGKTQWQRHAHGVPISLPQNALFTPYAYQKERILVKVCNSKFQTTLTATATPTPIPEAGLEVHGLTQATVTTTPQANVEMTFKAVQPVPSVPSAAVPISVTANEDLNYLTGLKDSYELEYEELEGSVHSFECSEPDWHNCNLDTPKYVKKSAEELYKAVIGLWNRKNEKAAETNQGQFALLATRTGALAASVSNLTSALTAASLATRYSKLLSDGQTLQKQGDVTTQVNTLQGDVRKLDKDIETAHQDIESAKEKLKNATADNLEAAQKALDDAEKKLRQYKQTQDYEKSLITAFSSLVKEINRVLEAPVSSDLAGRIQEIDSQTADLHHQASEVFKEMNDWHDHSNYTIASVVPPVSGNAVLTVVITLQDQFSPFGFGTPPAAKSTTPAQATAPGKANTKGGGGNNGDKGTTVAPGDQQQQQQQTQNPSPQQNAPPAATQYVVKRVLVEVHRLADVNVVSGFAVSTIPARSFGLHPYPSPTPGTAPTFQVAYQSQNTPFQYQYIVGLNIYLKKRDFFPGYLTKAMRFTPGVLVATSVTSAGNFKLGLDWEFWNGVDIYGGFDLGQVTRLGNGVVLGSTPFTTSATTVPTNTNFQGGGFFGLGFDASIFQSIFKKVFSQ